MIVSYLRTQNISALEPGNKRSERIIFLLSMNVSLWPCVRFTHRNVAVQSSELLSSINLLMEGRPQERRVFMRVVIIGT